MSSLAPFCGYGLVGKTNCMLPVKANGKTDIDIEHAV